MANAGDLRPPPLLVFADDWGRHPSSCQHLIGHLLDHREVVWVNTIGMRPPRLDFTTLTRGIERLRQWSRRGPSPRQDVANPHVLTPRMWPWFRSAFDRRLNRELLLRQLRPRIESLPTPPIAVTTIPIVADLIGPLPVARWVYYCVDDFGHWPGLDRDAMVRMDEQLARRADTLVAASSVLWEKLARSGRDVHLLTHGVDLDHWSNGPEAVPLPLLEGLPRPLMVFWGVVDRRMDVATLSRLADELLGGTILLVGPRVDPDPALDRLPRVAWRPPLPYTWLPALAREAEVLIMPYADLPVTRAMQPLKLLEYLATGKSVVVSDLPSIRPWADCLDVSESPASFARLVKERLRTGLPDHQRTARARLTAEDWAEKARRFKDWALESEIMMEVAT